MNLEYTINQQNGVMILSNPIQGNNIVNRFNDLAAQQIQKPYKLILHLDSSLRFSRGFEPFIKTPFSVQCSPVGADFGVKEFSRVINQICNLLSIPICSPWDTNIPMFCYVQIVPPAPPFKYMYITLAYNPYTGATVDTQNTLREL